MKASRYIVVSAAVALLSFSLYAQVNDTYVVTAAAATRGAGTTNWATAVDVFNPQAYWLTVSITFLPTHGAVGKEILLDIGPNENIHTESILDDWFGLRGTGSLLFATFPEDNPGVPDDVISRSFLVTTRTYNATANGSFGQAVPGVWAGLLDFDYDGISAIVPGVQNWGEIGENGFRTNVGAVNLGRSSVTLLVNVYDTWGDVVAQGLHFDLLPMGHEQQGLPVDVVDGSIEFFLDDPTQEAVVFPYIAIVDNLSGDGVYGNPTLLADPDILFKKQVRREDLGKKIDTAIAREVRARATRLGHLARDVSGRLSLQTVD